MYSSPYVPAARKMWGIVSTLSAAATGMLAITRPRIALSTISTLRGSNRSRNSPPASPPITTGAENAAPSQLTSAAPPPRSSTSQTRATNDIPSPSDETVSPPQRSA
jgi:hypothetical protein